MSNVPTSSNNLVPSTRKSHRKMITVNTRKTTYMDIDGNWTGENVFEKISLIGAGGFGEVWKVRHKSMRFISAAKIIKLNKSSSESIQKEIITFKQMKHPNILSYLGTYTEKDNVWIIMELCNAGSLKDIIKTLNTPLPEQAIACIIKGVVNGLEALHNANIIHLDIKPANILISDDCEVKLTDFGISKHVNDLCEDKWYGSAPYMAPEVVFKKPFTTKSDIWSLGITILELRERKPPYEDLTTMRILELIKKHPPPTFKNKEENSEEIMNFVALCLIKNSRQRATITQLKRHKFLTQVEDNQPVLNLCVSVYQAKYHLLPQIEILPDNKFAIKYLDKDDISKTQVRSFYSTTIKQQNQTDVIGTYPDNTLAGSTECLPENTELINEQFKAIEKLKNDIQILNEKVLSLEENTTLNIKETTEKKLKEIDNYKTLINGWTKEVVENMVNTAIDERLKEMYDTTLESTDGDISPCGVFVPIKSIESTESSREVSRENSPHLEDFNPRTPNRPNKKELKKNFNLSVKIPKEIISPRKKTLKKDENSLSLNSIDKDLISLKSKTKKSVTLSGPTNKFNSFESKSLKKRSVNSSKEIDSKPLQRQLEKNDTSDEKIKLFNNEINKISPKMSCCDTIPLHMSSIKIEKKTESPTTNSSSNNSLNTQFQFKKQTGLNVNITTSPLDINHSKLNELEPNLSNHILITPKTPNVTSTPLVKPNSNILPLQQTKQLPQNLSTQLNSTISPDKLHTTNSPQSTIIQRGISSPHSSRKESLRKFPMKQKRFSKQSSKILHGQFTSTTKSSLDPELENKVMALLRFELSKAKNAVCEMVPCHFEILRMELIDEIERRSKVYNFNNTISEGIPMKITDLENKINNLDNKIINVDIHLSQFKNELPFIITQFKNEVLDAFMKL
ncbi:hypothetical protein ENUP19_0285G0023 [Entamoeba nuttalli]|uniref:non-specific serine/threonine protein kinase n=2 Tax=Entamoeba nuttalli TaxID=412467 RepID=K2HNW3_ENTNP|nr:serine/threonine protein kinase, putative [Entamoeba nuttalli P19]EKE37545.1 serine/threonine protein kinase, putative [Entamoeba nuttalli P19]|eukprot:XP_008860125.1 serine/threonine protein kinase, putative [Entamoeba nuttalli P19]